MIMWYQHCHLLRPSAMAEMKLLTIAIFITQGTCIASQGIQVYEKYLHGMDKDTSTASVLTDTNTGSTGDCARLCLTNNCWMFRMSGTTCTLYELNPVLTSPQPGAVYYTQLGGACPVHRGFIYVTQVRMCILLSAFDDERQHADSESQCQSLGSTLVILDTAEKHNSVVDYITASEINRPVWVGMTKVDGSFRWSDGGNHTVAWQPDEPDYIPDQNCVGISTTGLADLYCASGQWMYRYICEVIL